MVGEGWAQVLSRLQGLLWQSSSFQKRNVIYPFSIYIFATYYVQGTLTRNRKSHNRFNCMLPPPRAHAFPAPNFLMRWNIFLVSLEFCSKDQKRKEAMGSIILQTYYGRTKTHLPGEDKCKDRALVSTSSYHYISYVFKKCDNWFTNPTNSFL